MVALSARHDHLNLSLNDTELGGCTTKAAEAGCPTPAAQKRAHAAGVSTLLLPIRPQQQRQDSARVRTRVVKRIDRIQAGNRAHRLTTDRTGRQAAAPITLKGRRPGRHAQRQRPTSNHAHHKPSH